MSRCTDPVAQSKAIQVKDVAVARRAGRRQRRGQRRIKLRTRDRRQITICAACVMHIAQTEGYGQGWFDLPRIACVRHESIVGPQSASGQTKCRFFRREPQTITHDYEFDRVIQRVAGPAGERSRRRIKRRWVSVYGRRQAEEAGKSTALDVVIANSVAHHMRTYGLASVILGLKVLLIGLLRGKRVGSGTESVSAIQTGSI